MRVYVLWRKYGVGVLHDLSVVGVRQEHDCNQPVLRKEGKAWHVHHGIYGGEVWGDVGSTVMFGWVGF
jgi:hypothetical protein